MKTEVNSRNFHSFNDALNLILANTGFPHGHFYFTTKGIFIDLRSESFNPDDFKKTIAELSSFLTFASPIWIMDNHDNVYGVSINRIGHFGIDVEGEQRERLARQLTIEADLIISHLTRFSLEEDTPVDHDHSYDADGEMPTNSSDARARGAAGGGGGGGGGADRAVVGSNRSNETETDSSPWNLEDDIFFPGDAAALAGSIKSSSGHFS